MYLWHAEHQILVVLGAKKHKGVVGAKEVAGKGVGSVGIHDDVDIVQGPNKELKKPAGHVALFRHAIWSFLSKAPMYLQQEAKLEYPGADH